MARAASRFLLDINTDNRNRTVSEIRHVFGKNGGNMAEAGAVSWMFHKKGDIVIPKTAAKEDDLMNIVLEAGGEDLNDDGENWEILTEPSAYEAVLEAVKKAGIEPASSSVAMIPQNYIKLEGAGRQHDDPPDGSAGRSGRRAERPLELRHRSEVAGRSCWIVLQQERSNSRPDLGRLFIVVATATIAAFEQPKFSTHSWKMLWKRPEVAL